LKLWVENVTCRIVLLPTARKLYTRSATAVAAVMLAAMLWEADTDASAQGSSVENLSVSSSTSGYCLAFRIIRLQLAERIFHRFTAFIIAIML